MKFRSWSRKDANEEVHSPSRVVELWEVSLQHGEETPTHQHESREELLIALEGRGEVQKENGALELFPGHVVVVPAGTPFSLLNRSGLPMRGLLVAIHRPGLVVPVEQERVTAGELEDMIENIPARLGRAQALQAIITLFDLAGHLSEQIESAIGLNTETGLRTLEAIEEQVMGADVRISRAYFPGVDLQPPRF
ncbi:MAG: cupin domain-containing protein [Proteobacteria bacterium]|nr:cupin domain-containing protein [Pseudomonadota bacterium]